MSSIWVELKRRNVVKVAAAYAVVGWLLIEVASILLPTFQAPEWIMRVFSFFIILGFPIALILSWAYELTPEGIKTAKSIKLAASIRKVTGRKKDTRHGRVQTAANSYSICLGKMTINVTLGRIEQVDCNDRRCLIALPANEFFDDECISDSGSALGAFMGRHFAEKISDIQALVKDALIDEPSDPVEKRPGEIASSYGVGKCVYLNRPLGSDFQLALVAVTTQRADVGLQGDAAYIFQAAASLERLMANNRLTSLTIPILGSGHGGVDAEVSLLCMLIAFSQMHRRQSGHNLKELNIIVFRRSDDDVPTIHPELITPSLDFISRFYQR